MIIDLGRGGFKLTGLEEAVSFDLDADGEKEWISWTDPRGGDALLVLDRNGNGAVDDGTELFGGVTPQPASDSPNGYRALAVYDQPEQGGDGDGWVREGEPVFAQLRLWLDTNHDGISQPQELTPLSAAGIRGLSVRPVSSARRDPHGNLFRWAGLVAFDQGRRLASADVILLRR